MDGLGHALDSLGVGPSSSAGATTLTYLFEIDTRCRQVLSEHRCRSNVILSTHTDSAGLKGSVQWLVEGDPAGIVLLLREHPSIELVLEAGGSPCVGFSRARLNGLGMKDAQSRQLWLVPVIAALGRQELQSRNPSFIWIYILENVIPEEPRWADNVSACLGVPPLAVDSGDFSACSRPRLFWTNLQPPPPPKQPHTNDQLLALLEPGWSPLWQLPGLQAQSKHTSFGTFLRPFKAGAPSEFPRPYRRLPLSSYSTRGLVFRTSSTPAQLSDLLERTAKHVLIATKDLRVSGSKACRLRGELVDWIHTQDGSSVVRPLSHLERDRLLGFPSGASSLSSDPAELFNWGAVELTGNSFSVHSMAHILRPFAAWLTHGTPLDLHNGFPSCLTEQLALAVLDPADSGNASR